jgi:hypothetical protein
MLLVSGLLPALSFVMVSRWKRLPEVNPRALCPSLENDLGSQHPSKYQKQQKKKQHDPKKIKAKSITVVVYMQSLQRASAVWGEVYRRFSASQFFNRCIATCLIQTRVYTFNNPNSSQRTVIAVRSSALFSCAALSL